MFYVRTLSGFSITEPLFTYTMAIKVEWWWNSLGSFVICFCQLFWTWPFTTFNSIPIILNLLTNRNMASIYSVSICEQKTKDCAWSGSFQHKLQHLLFSTLMFAGFHNQPPLLTMLTPLFSRAVPGSEIVGSAESRKHENENKTGGRAAFLIPLQPHFP